MRFVLRFEYPLKLGNDNVAVVRVQDLIAAKAVYEEGTEVPFVDLFSQKVDMKFPWRNLDIVSFMSWVVMVFGYNCSGLVISVDEGISGKIRELFASPSVPDLWLYSNRGFASLLWFDPFDCFYKVVDTWIEGFGKEIPTTADRAVRLIKPFGKRELILQFLAANPMERAILAIDVSRMLS